MLVGILTVDVFHHLPDGVGMGLVVVGEHLHGPIHAVVIVHSVAVHKVNTPRNIVVMPTVSIYRPVGLYRLPHLGGDVLGQERPAGSLALACGWLAEGKVDFHSPCEWVEEHLRVPCQSAHPCGGAALRVVIKCEQILVMVVHREPCRLVVALGHLTLHAGDDAQSAARDGDIGEHGVLVGLDKCDGIGEFFGRHMVEVGHKRACVSENVLLAAPSVQSRLTYNTRAAGLYGLHQHVV